jgi:hypothetical protein
MYVTHELKPVGHVRVGEALLVLPVSKTTATIPRPSV